MSADHVPQWNTNASPDATIPGYDEGLVNQDAVVYGDDGPPPPDPIVAAKMTAPSQTDAVARMTPTPSPDRHARRREQPRAKLVDAARALFARRRGSRRISTSTVTRR